VISLHPIMATGRSSDRNDTDAVEDEGEDVAAYDSKMFSHYFQWPSEAGYAMMRKRRIRLPQS
jgi:hypothetical protein